MTDQLVRAFEFTDTDACYEICLRTGDHGRDATDLYRDPRVIGEYWVGPYLERWPEHAFVVVTNEVVGGYIVGAPDTDEHHRWMEAEWLPPLRLRYPIGCFPTGTADYDTVELIHRPPTKPKQLISGYPGHLHIDLLPGFQRRGYGTALMSAFLDSLRSAGVPAVHLGVSPLNPGAVAFYKSLGFRDLGNGTIWGRSTDPI